jgi:hypothetical protein
MADSGTMVSRGEGGAIALAIVAAAAIVTFGSSDGPRYQLAAIGDLIVRMDNGSGAMIACDRQRCRQIQPPDRAATANRVRKAIGSDQGSDQNSENQQRQISQQ